MVRGPYGAGPLGRRPSPAPSTQIGPPNPRQPGRGATAGAARPSGHDAPGEPEAQQNPAGAQCPGQLPPRIRDPLGSLGRFMDSRGHGRRATHWAMKSEGKVDPAG